MRAGRFFKFSYVALINSLLNLFLYSMFVLWSNGENLLICYVISSSIVTLFAYFLIKYVVFKSKKTKFLKFLFFELLLILGTVIVYSVVQFYWETQIILGTLVIYGTRLVVAFLLNRKLFVDN